MKVAKLGVLLMAATILAGCADPGEAQPSPHASAATDPYERSLLGFAHCMSELGWDATVSDGGATVSDVPASQRDVQQRDAQLCSDEWLSLDVRTFTDTEWEAAYDEALSTATCLQDEFGFSITPPSMQVFKEGEAGWNPYFDLVSAGEIEPAAIFTYETTCPQPAYWPDRG